MKSIVAFRGCTVFDILKKSIDTMKHQSIIDHQFQWMWKIWLQWIMNTKNEQFIIIGIFVCTLIIAERWNILNILKLKYEYTFKKKKKKKH